MTQTFPRVTVTFSCIIKYDKTYEELITMTQKEAWNYFEKTGSVEAYLLYHALDSKEKEPDDLQSQGYSAAHQTNDP